jgi:hypothetical protein
MRSSPALGPRPTCAPSATASARWNPASSPDVIVASGNPLDDVALLADAANIALVVQEGRVVKERGQWPPSEARLIIGARLIGDSVTGFFA